jgi:hypothetical protein
MRNTADVTGDKPIAVLLQSISSVNAINPLIAFYDIHGGKESYSFILSRTPHVQVNISASVFKIRAVLSPQCVV